MDSAFASLCPRPQIRQQELWSVKNLFRTLQGSWQIDPEVRGQPVLTTPVSQACTQSQFEEASHLRWCELIHEEPRLHRKQWEYSFILQALEVTGVMEPGSRGLGFGVGSEPLPATLATRGCQVLATDLPMAGAVEAGSAKTADAVPHVEALNDRHICDPEVFESRVDFRYLDMRSMPNDLRSFDFCWSSGALQHLGTIDEGLDFVVRSLETLRPGGVAVHTTELNCASDKDTLSRGGTVLFRKSDLRRLAKQLRAEGHTIELNFNLGDGPVDRHIDLPPYTASPHLKIKLQQFVTTSFGLIVRKADAKEHQPRTSYAKERPQATVRSKLEGYVARLSSQIENLTVELNSEHRKSVTANAIAPPADASDRCRVEYFDIWRLLKEPRENNEAMIRGSCRNSYLGDHTSLCRVLGRYKTFVDTRDIGIASHLLLDGFWEMWVTEEMLRRVRPGMTALDIGANLGYFSLLLADLTGPSGRVLSFEPNPRMCSLARRSIEVNGFASWTHLHEIALGAEPGEVAFNAELDQPGGAHVVSGGEQATFSVPVRRLDQIEGALDAEFIKMDVEGFEPYVWRGMEGLLRRKKALTIFMEFNVSRFADPGAFLDEILSNGFSLSVISLRDGAQPTTREDLLGGPQGTDHMLLFQRGDLST